LIQNKKNEIVKTENVVVMDDLEEEVEVIIIGIEIIENQIIIKRILVKKN